MPKVAYGVRGRNESAGYRTSSSSLIVFSLSGVVNGLLGKLLGKRSFLDIGLWLRNIGTPKPVAVVDSDDALEGASEEWGARNAVG